MTWERVKLGEITESCLGKMLDQNKNKGTYQKYLANVNVRWGSFDLDNLAEMRFEDDETERYGVRYGDLIVCEGGEPGRCAIWKDEVPNMKIQKALHRVRVLPEKADAFYLLYWFIYAGQRKELVQYFTGATIKHMPGDKLKQVVVALPDLPTQHRIASIFSAYDDLIENNRRQIKLLEEAAQRLYREWFVELRFPGHEDVKIVDGVPEGWKKVKLQEICPVKTGKKDANFGTTDGKYPFFTCAQAPIQAPSYSFDCSAVILAGNGDFNVKIYRGQFEAYQRTYVLSPLDLEHLFLLFNSVRMNMDVLTKGASGSTIKFLTKGMIDSIELLIPPALLLDQYNKISESIQSKVELLKHKIDLSTEVRDMLLPKLMSGEMEVSS